MVSENENETAHGPSWAEHKMSPEGKNQEPKILFEENAELLAVANIW